MADDPWAAFNPQAADPKAAPQAPPQEAPAPAPAPANPNAVDEFSAFAPQVDYSDLNNLPVAFKQRLQAGQDHVTKNPSTMGSSLSAIWDAAMKGGKAGMDAEHMEKKFAGWKEEISAMPDSIYKGALAGGEVMFEAGERYYNALKSVYVGAAAGGAEAVSQIAPSIGYSGNKDAAKDAITMVTTPYSPHIPSMADGAAMALTLAPPGLELRPAVVTANGEFARLTRNPTTGQTDAQVVGRMPTPEDFKSVATELGGGAKVEQRLKDAWDQNGMHPVEILEAAKNDAFVAHDLGAAANTTPPLVPPSQQPLSGPSRLAGDLRMVRDKAMDAISNVQEMIASISKASDPAIRYTMEVQSKRRRVDWDRDRAFQDIDKRFDAETQKDVFRRMDEENAVQMGLADRAEYPGLQALKPEARAWAEEWTQRATEIRAMMLDREMVTGDGMKVYMPYLYEGIEKGAQTVGAPGYTFREATGTMRQRKYMTPGESEAAAKAKFGPKATLVENMKALPQALAEQEKAIHMHDYLESIKKFGRDIGEPQLLTEEQFRGLNNPAAKADYVLFNVGDLAQWKYLGETANGEKMLFKGAIAIKKEWAPAVKAILDTKFNKWDKLVQNVKNRPMALIMNSPFIHLSVVYGKAFPKDPGMMASFRWVNEGRSLVQDQQFMKDIIEGGYVWWGRKGGGAFEDALHGNPVDVNFKPGRSWTAQSLGYAADVIFGEEAGIKTKMGIDALGKLVHDKMLGNSVNYIGLSIAKKRLDYMAAKFPDMDRSTLMIDAAHFGNRFAGSIAPEAVSALSRGIADGMFFSRKFTFGNIGIAKDAATGAPKYVNARILEELKEKWGPEAETLMKEIKTTQHVAFSKALIMDFVLMYGVNALAQIGVNQAVTWATGRPPDEGTFWERWQDATNKVSEHPFNPMSYLSFVPSLSPAYNREPGKENRILFGHRPDGTAIYVRTPLGRMGEDYMGVVENPGKWMQNKMAPATRALLEIYQNEDSFGRHIYTPGTHLLSAEGVHAAIAIAKHIAKSNLPMAQIEGAARLTSGEGDVKDALAAFGPYLPPPVTVTASQGYPGGPKVGVTAEVSRHLQFQKDMAMSGIMKDIKAGNIGEAREAMDKLGIDKGLQKYYLRIGPNPALRMSPKAMRKFYEHATPEQQRLLERVQ